MNLENLNLVPLSAYEVQEIDGGFIILLILLAECALSPGGVALGLGIYNGYHSNP
jgi:hypothetical protein